MSNQVKVLSEVLAIDAWHKPFRTDGQSASLHVELSFHQGRIGGDKPDIPFTFRIGLKKAVLSVILEKPLQIDRATVARTVPVNTLEHTRLIQLKNQASRNTTFAGKLNLESLKAEAGVSADSRSSKETDDQLRFVSHIPNVIATPKPRGSNEFAWELLPGQTATLDGEPWNPVEEPRLSVKSLLQIPRLIPSIKVILSCKFEDIEIDNIELKDSGIISIAKEAFFNRANEAAAIQQLKLALRDAELEFGSIDDKFSDIVIADIIAVEQ